MTGGRLRVEAPGRDPLERAPEGGAFVIGRSANADLSVDDDRMSRKHARFTHRAGEWWVEDLGSSNGTLLNGRTITGDVRLAAGDVVSLGNTRVVVVADPAPSAAQPGVSTTAEEVQTPSAAGLKPRAPAIEDDQSADAGRLRILNDVHRALATPITLADLLDLILDRVFAVLAPEEAVIVLREADGTLRHAAARRLPGARGELVVSRRLADEVIGKRMPAVVLDALMDERFAVAESMVLSGVRSIAAAPIVDAEGCLGMIALYSRVRVRKFTDADLDLLVSLASTAALRVRNVALMEEAAARRVLDHELALAHEIQMGMLPRRYPDCESVEVGAALKPARSVGGDFYDVEMAGGRLWFIVGDVSGKGVASALFMAVARTLFRAVRHGGASVAETVARLNRELSRDNERAMFVTAFAGWLDPATGRLAVCNAGHNPPFLVRADGRTEPVTAGGGPALGVFDDQAYAEENIRLAPGEALVVYTDGATDARSPAGEQFGLARVERTIQESARSHASASRLVDDLFRSLQAFETSAAQEDDITLLALRYTGPECQVPGAGC
jgi:serine phosphatase RsbU (regulator of sigma subunit)/pSer/pThr/pTyr-binding forkhead associated (FHA) protein